MASLATAWVDIVPRFKDLSSTFNRELRGIDATGAGSRLGSQLGDGLTAGAKTGGTKLSDMLTGVTKSAVTGFGKIGKVGLGAITTIGGGITALAAKGGFARALNIENAQAKLKGLGHSAETIGEIMANANLAVKGTAYGLDEAASVAAAAVASGIKPGEQLTQVLKTVGDTAQIAGMGFSDAGAIFTSVMARGKLQGDDMLQLTSRGVPVLQALSDQLGVSTQDVSEMVSKGKVDFQTFATALDKYLGGSALAAGETFSGAMANVKAALSRVGQKAATPALNALRDTFNVLTPAIDKVNTALEPLADKLGTRLSNAVQTVTPWIQRFADGMADGSITIQDIAKHVGLLVGALGGFTALGQFGPQILDVFTTAGNGSGALVSLVSGNMGKIRGVVSGAGGLFTDLGTRWGNAMGLIDANFGGVFGMMANRARSGLSGIGTTMVGLFDSKIYLPLQQGIGGIGAKIAAPFQALAGRVGGFLSPVTSAFGTAFQGIRHHIGRADTGRIVRYRQPVPEFFQPGELPQILQHRRHTRRTGARVGRIEHEPQRPVADLRHRVPDHHPARHRHPLPNMGGGTVARADAIRVDAAHVGDTRHHREPAPTADHGDHAADHIGGRHRQRAAHADTRRHANGHHPGAGHRGQPAQDHRIRVEPAGEIRRRHHQRHTPN